MRYVAPLRNLEPAKLDALAASLRGWLFLLAAWLAEHLGPALFGPALSRDLDRRLHEARRHAENIVFLHAMHRLPNLRPAPRFFRTPPRGFRSTASRAAGRRRLFHIAGLARGSLRERAQKLAQLLANPEAAIARAVRRLRRARHGATLQVAAPPAADLSARTYACAGAACADTS